MSEESHSSPGSPEEKGEPTVLERLEKAAEEQGKADTKVKKTKQAIAAKKERIDRLRGEIRTDEAKLPEMILGQQGADDTVNELLLELEKKLNLKVQRIQPAGPVAQGGTAKFKAMYHKLPAEVKLSWDTGGCPFTEEEKGETEETITVDTSPVAPGDYDISASLVLAGTSADPTSAGIKTDDALAATSK